MTNKLAYVDDKDGFTNQNDYTGANPDQLFIYDAIGNLTEDPVEEIDKIEWTVYGKVKSITRENTSSKPDLEFKYDAMGNRIMKLEKPRTGSGLDNENEWVYSYYQYDAGGNMLAIYDKRYLHISGNNYQTVLKVKEMNLYGSSRLGIDGRDKILVEEDFTATISGGLFTGINVTSTNYIADDPNLMDRTLGKKAFELSNHLGNVLATVSDKKFLNQTSGNAKVYASSYENNDGGIFVNGSYLGMQSTTQVNTNTYSVEQNEASSPIGPKAIIPLKSGDVINSTSVYFYFELPQIGSNDGQLVRSLVDANGVALYKDAVGTTTKEVGLPLYFPASWQQLSIGGTTTIQSTYYYADGTALPTCDAVYLEVYTECTDGTVWFDDISFSVTPAVESYYTADIQTRQMYYPFGMVMPNGDNLNMADHTYGFQGQLNDNEVKGAGNSVNFKYRMHDPRLGRFFAVDPLTGKYPYYTPYSFSGNRVIDMIELEGTEPTSPKYQWSASAGFEYKGNFYNDGSALSKVEGWWVHQSLDSDADEIHMFWSPSDGVWKEFTPVKPEPLAPTVTRIAIRAIAIPGIAVAGATILPTLLPEIAIVSEAVALETAAATIPVVDMVAYTVASNPVATGAVLEFTSGVLLNEPMELSYSSGSPAAALIGQTIGIIRTFIDEDKAQDLECLMCPDFNDVQTLPQDFPRTDATNVVPVTIRAINTTARSVSNLSKAPAATKAASSIAKSSPRFW